MDFVVFALAFDLDFALTVTSTTSDSSNVRSASELDSSGERDDPAVKSTIPHHSEVIDSRQKKRGKGLKHRQKRPPDDLQFQPSDGNYHESVNNSNLIGTGPWKLVNRMTDGHLLFEKNSNYFTGPPKLEKLKIRILPETLPRTAEFITGYLDIMEIPDAEYELWINDEEWMDHIYHQNQLNIYYIGLNCSRPPFNDVKVRQAVNYAVDVESIINYLFNGRGIFASGPIPPELIGETTQHYYYDTTKALNLLKKSGYENGFEIDLWQSQSQENSLVTEIIQFQLQKIGITVNIKRNDWNMFTQAIREGTPDMYYRSWYADYPDAENFIAPLIESTISKTRWNRYENKKLDTLIIKIQSETDQGIRTQLIKHANTIITEEAPWIFLWHSQTAYAINPKLKNWSPSIMFNAENYTKVWKE